MAPRGHQLVGLRVAKARMALPGPPSQREFADRLGIHWVTQSNIENDKAKVSLDLLEKIAEATGTTREHLLGADDDAEEDSSLPSHAEMLELLRPFKPVAPYVRAFLDAIEAQA